MKQAVPRGHLDLLLLAILDRGPVHGYGVVAALAERSGGVCDFPEGTVYPALQKLEREGLVRSDWAADGKRRRRVYALSAAGRTALAKRQSEWARFRQGVEKLLAWPAPAAI